jgi:hypothetical protein
MGRRRPPARPTRLAAAPLLPPPSSVLIARSEDPPLSCRFGTDERLIVPSSDGG